MFEEVGQRELHSWTVSVFGPARVEWLHDTLGRDGQTEVLGLFRVGGVEPPLLAVRLACGRKRAGGQWRRRWVHSRDQIWVSWRGQVCHDYDRSSLGRCARRTVIDHTQQLLRDDNGGGVPA